MWQKLNENGKRARLCFECISRTSSFRKLDRLNTGILALCTALPDARIGAKFAERAALGRGDRLRMRTEEDDEMRKIHRRRGE